MTLEFFEGACEGRGLVLLYGGAAEEVVALRGVLQQLDAVGDRAVIHTLEFVESVAACRLVATAGSKGSGVQFAADEQVFEWVLSPAEWQDISWLLGPFCEDTDQRSGTQFQYLNPHGGPQVIYSTGRSW
jgi:hypothetical protein